MQNVKFECKMLNTADSRVTESIFNRKPICNLQEILNMKKMDKNKKSSKSKNWIYAGNGFHNYESIL